MKAFDGEDVTEILGAIVKSEPDWTRLAADTPAAIRVLLKRCLRKNPRERLDSAAAVGMEVADASTGGEHVAATSSSPGSGSIVAAVLAVVTVATLIAALIPKSENAAMGTEVQFEIAEQDAVSNLYQLAISPWWPAHRLRWILEPPAAPVAVVNRVAASRGHQLRDQRLLVARQDGR